MDANTLYQAFSESELRRLYEIKASPTWTPREDLTRKGGRNAKLQVKIPRRLKDRLFERCTELGITVSDYINALLEVMLSEDNT